VKPAPGSEKAFLASDGEPAVTGGEDAHVRSTAGILPQVPASPPPPARYFGTDI